MNDLHDIEDRLRDATHAYADAVEPAPDAWEQITRRTRGRSHRRRAIWIGATSAVAAAALFAGALLISDDDRTRRVKTPPAVTTPTTHRSDAWTRLPTPPPHLGDFVWTGTEMLGWENTGVEGSPSLGDAYNPSTRTWRRIAAMPGYVRGFPKWTGARVVFWDPTTQDGQRPTVATAYDPARDRWTQLAPGPITSGGTAFVTVAIGKDLVILANPSSDVADYPNPQAAALDPTTGTWRDLRGLRDQKNFTPADAIWDGKEVIVTGGISTCPNSDPHCNKGRPAVMAYDPATDRSREIQLDVTASGLAAATRDRLLFWSMSGTGSDSTWKLLSFDRRAGTWDTPPPPTCPRPFDAWGILQDPTNKDVPIWSCPDGTVVWFDTLGGRYQQLGKDVPFQATSTTGVWTGTDLIVLADKNGARFGFSRQLHNG